MSRRDQADVGGAGARGEADDDGLSLHQLRHLLHAPLRRPAMVLLPWAGIVLLAAAALVILPKRYRSTTLILIESERVPESFVAKVATEDASRRIDNITPQILSRTRLERVVAETNPYPDLASTTRAVDQLRQNAWVNPSGNDGFTIEFVHRDPRKAQEVASRLATLFIGESAQSREQQVEDAVDFLVAQVADARKQLESKDEALRLFKERRMGRLPEQLDANLATLEMLQRELHSVDESLFLAREKQDALARGVDRIRTSSGGEALDPEGLEALQARLAALRARYTEEHPDVEQLRARIARMESNLARTSTAPAAASSQVTQAQLKRVEAEVARLEERRSELQQQTAAIRGRVEETPRTEQELSNLKRDYEKLSENYTALLAKQLEAQMAGRLERRWKGDQFRILDPAHLPDKPDFPKPMRLLGLGLILGLLVGLVASIVAEMLDPTIKDADDLSGLVDYPVLARLPHIPARRAAAP